MIWLYICASVVVFAFICLGIALMTPKDRKLAIKIITFPIIWVFSMVYGFFSFPVYYFKRMNYNRHKPVPVRFEVLKDGKIKMVLPNGQEKVYTEESK